MKYYIFGDTGGHAARLSRALLELGWDRETFKLPEDVTIIHVGDLIHKGPHSEIIIDNVDRIIDVNPGQWIQLMGNHESQYFQGAPWFWSTELLDEEHARILHKWRANGDMKIAHTIPSFEKFLNLEISAKPKIVVPEKPIIVTHAGITRDWWVRTISQFPEAKNDAVVLADVINTRLSIKQFSIPGRMLGVFGTSPGPIWAACIDELWESWKDSEVIPFIQVHGHTAPYHFPTNRWWYSPKEYKQTTKLNPESRVATTRVGDSLQISVDPGYAKSADTFFQPSLQLIS